MRIRWTKINGKRTHFTFPDRSDRWLIIRHLVSSTIHDPSKTMNSLTLFHQKSWSTVQPCREGFPTAPISKRPEYAPGEAYGIPKFRSSGIKHRVYGESGLVYGQLVNRRRRTVARYTRGVKQGKIEASPEVKVRCTDRIARGPFGRRGWQWPGCPWRQWQREPVSSSCGT